MSWFGSVIDGPLVLTRAIHFAASTTTAGGVMFRAFVAEPALQTSPARYAMVRARIAALTWTGLAIAAVTGLVWFVLQTMSMTGLASGDAMRSGAMLTVANETQFGLVSEIRGRLAGVAALILSGIVNAWILVGSFRALLVTDYGQLLLLKIAAFVVMVGFAAVNRFWLTPQLALVTNAQAHTNALSALTRNTLIEIALGLRSLPWSECSARCIPPSTS